MDTNPNTPEEEYDRSGEPEMPDNWESLTTATLEGGSDPYAVSITGSGIDDWEKELRANDPKMPDNLDSLTQISDPHDYTLNDTEQESLIEGIDVYYRGAVSDQRRLNMLEEGKRLAHLDPLGEALVGIGTETIGALWGIGEVLTKSNLALESIAELPEEDQVKFKEMYTALVGGDIINEQEGRAPEFGQNMNANPSRWDSTDKVMRHVSDPEEFRRIANLLYINSREIAKKVIQQRMEKTSVPPVTEDGMAVREALSNNWAVDAVDYATTFLPNLAYDQLDGLEPGSNDYDFYLKLGDAINVTQMVAGPGAGAKAMTLAKQGRSTLKVARAQAKLDIIQKGLGGYNAAGKKLGEGSIIAAAALLTQSLGKDLASVATKIDNIKDVIPGFEVSSLEAASTATGRRAKASLNRHATSGELETDVALKDKQRQALLDSEAEEYNTGGGDRAAALKSDKRDEALTRKVAKEIEKEESAYKLELAKLDLEVAKLEAGMLIGNGSDAMQTAFYDSMVKLEEKVRERGRKKFASVSDTDGGVRANDLLDDMSAYLSNSDIVNSGLKSIIATQIKLIDTHAAGLRPKGSPVVTSLMQLHDLLSELKHQRRLLSFSNEPSRGGANIALSNLINKIQGVADPTTGVFKGGLFDEFVLKSSIKNKDKLLDAMKFWREEVIERFESWPVYNIGGQAKSGKMLVTPPEVINNLIKEMKAGNTDLVGILERTIGGGPGGAKMWKQLHETVLDGFIRDVTKGNKALSIEQLAKYFSNVKNRRPFAYLPGMSGYLKNIDTVLEGILTRRKEIIKNQSDLKKLKLFQQVNKEGIFTLTSPKDLIAFLMSDRLSAKRVNEIAKKLGYTEQLKEMVGKYILNEAAKGIGDPLLSNAARNHQKIIDAIDNHRQALNQLMGVYHVKRLEQFHKAWKYENESALPNVGGVGAGEGTAKMTAANLFKANIASVISDAVAVQKMSVGVHWMTAKWMVKAWTYSLTAVKSADIEFILRQAHMGDNRAMDILEAIQKDAAANAYRAAHPGVKAINAPKADNLGMDHLIKYLQDFGHIEALDLGDLAGNPVLRKLLDQANDKMTPAQYAEWQKSVERKMRAILSAGYLQQAGSQDDSRSKDQGAL